MLRGIQKDHHRPKSSEHYQFEISGFIVIVVAYLTVPTLPVTPVMDVQHPGWESLQTPHRRPAGPKCMISPILHLSPQDYFL